MPRLTNTVISDQLVRSARPGHERYEIRDAELRGFMLRISPSGAKSWYVQLDRHRKRKIGDAGVLTTSMARYRARDLLQRREHLQMRADGRQPSLKDFLLGRYLRWKERRSRYGKRDTRRLVSALGDLAERPLDQVGVSQIERWRLQRSAKVSPATVQRELAALKAALNCAIRWRLLTSNPAANVRRPAPAKTAAPRVLNAMERRALMTRLSERQDALAAITLTALNTGLSRGELFRLRWKDIHFGTNASLKVVHARRFRNRNRKVPLNAEAVRVLSEWRQLRRRRGMLVFPSPSGGVLKSIHTPWRRLMKETGIRDFRFCDCRHDFAARLVSSGVDLGRVAQLLGHSTLALTGRYASFAPGDTRSAVNKLTTG